MNDFFKARDVLKVGDKEYVIYRLEALEKAGLTELKKLPFSIRIVLHRTQEAPLLDSNRPRSSSPPMQRKGNYASRCEEHCSMDTQSCPPRHPPAPCPRGHAGFHGRASCR